jgi:hypothetical protein
MLASYMGKKSTCYPSFISLGKDCRLHKNSLIRYTKKLEEKGLLKIVREYEKNNIYSFTNLILSGLSQRPGSLSQRPQVVSHRDPNNKSNNINNKKSFYPQDQNQKAAIQEWKGLAKSDEYISPLLTEFIDKKSKKP